MPLLDVDAEAVGGNVDGAEGCDATVPGVNCPNKMPGSNETASAITGHRRRVLGRSRFGSGLKSERSSNADLVIIETEKIERAAVLAVEIIDAGTQKSGD